MFKSQSKLHPSELALVHHDTIPVPDTRNTEMLWGWILENERVHGTQAVIDLIASTEFGRRIAVRVNQLDGNDIQPRRHAAPVSLDNAG